MNRYLFLIKGKTIVPINFHEHEMGEITLSLIKELYLVSPIQIKASSSKEAMRKFLAMNNNIDLNEVKESTIC